ncbi:hypothetical protein HDE_07792 [Halotydeus destructor]|nr:hypothetical protein HDE_07792 [Halotydeus destructor]
MTEKTSEVNVKKCRNITRFIFPALILLLLITMIANLVTSYRCGPYGIWNLFVTTFIEPWPEFTTYAYHYYLCHVYFMDETSHQEMRDRLSKVRPRECSVDHAFEIMAKKKCDEVKTQFNDQFGIILLAQLSNLLIYTSAMIMLIRSDDTEKLYYEMFYYSKYLLLYLTSFGAICYVQHRMKKRCEDSVEYIMSLDKEISPGTLALMTELTVQVPLTGMGQFTVEPRLLLNFSGSLVSFTVLFIQVAT